MKLSAAPTLSSQFNAVFAICTGLLFVSSELTPIQAQKPFSIQVKWKVGGEDGWDYLLADSGAHRLYITLGTRVEALDSDAGKTLGAITELKGTHGVALDDSGKFG